MRLLFWASVFLIVYGSLYPFEFAFSGLGSVDFAAFLTDWSLVSGRGDLLGNIGLFIPYGFFGILMLRPGRPRVRPLMWLCLSGFVAAAGVQVIQLAIPARSAVMGDVVWNIAGLALGVLLALPGSVRRAFQPSGQTGLRPEMIPLALMACWLAAELAPFVPSIDFQSFKDSLKPLLRTPQFDAIDFLRAVVGWSVFGWLMTRALPRRNALTCLPLVMAGTLFGKVLIVRNVIAVDDVAGMIAALALIAALRRPSPSVPAGLITACLVLAGLEPFNIAGSGSFQWIPFSGSLTGSMIFNLSAIAVKLYLIGALFFFAADHGWPPEKFWLVAAPGLFVLEILQVWVGNHTAEITDPLLAAAIAYGFVRYRRGVSAVPADAATEGEPAAPASAGVTAPPAAAFTLSDRTWPIPGRNGVLWLGGICVLFAGVLYVVMGLPKVPYNVRDLFGGDNAWWRLFFFALAVFSIGIGGTLAGYRTARARLPVLALPGWVFVATFASYLLLVVSVTNETMGDISGSTHTWYFVTEKNIWGETGAAFYHLIGSRDLVGIVERIIRFTALFAPLFMWLAIVTGLYFKSRSSRSQFVRRGGGVSLFRTGSIYVLAALPWLWLAAFVAFEKSSTDNLNELIKNNGGWLYPLLILYPLCALALAHAVTQRSLRSAFVCAVTLIVSLPLGWFLFRNGFSAPVHKYGLTFTGADFLLGPDRKQKLPEAVLMMRYSALHIGAILTLTFGMRLIFAAAFSRTGPKKPTTGQPASQPSAQAPPPQPTRSFLRD